MMRATTVFAAALGMTGVSPGPAAAQSKACLEMSCFSERQVRDFEIIDRDTMVIYVGRERCAYKVKVDDLYCDLTFLPEVAFFDTRLRNLNARVRGANPTDDLLGTRSASGGFNDRICINSNSIALETFEFADTVTEAPIGQAPCEIREFDTITDDELLEVYVSEGLVPPPPPIGNGELSRTDELTAEPADALPEEPAEGESGDVE